MTFPTLIRRSILSVLGLIAVFAVVADGKEITLTTLLTLVGKGGATPKSVVAVLGSPKYCFLPNAEAGYGGTKDQLMFRYETKLKVVKAAEVQLYVILGDQGRKVESVDVNFDRHKGDCPSRDDIRKALGNPERIVHVKWIGKMEDEELSLGTCDDPSGETEIWLYARGIDVYYLTDDFCASRIMMHLPGDVKTKYPKCK